ncbi:pleckstrin-like domain family A member 2-like [Arapaima gigas]
MSTVEVSRVLKEGQLEKRSDNLLQLWRRKVCVLTTDSLNIYDDAHKRSKAKELKLQSIKKLDCVERTGRFVYFTIVTTEDKEIDFRTEGPCRTCGRSRGAAAGAARRPRWRGTEEEAEEEEERDPLRNLCINSPRWRGEPGCEKMPAAVKDFQEHFVHVELQREKVPSWSLK